MAQITRIGTVQGRFPRYRLVVDGVDLGEVRRVVTAGKDGNRGRAQPRYDSWRIHGTDCPSQDRAEALLIERAIRFGNLSREG